MHFDLRVGVFINETSDENLTLGRPRSLSSKVFCVFVQPGVLDTHPQRTTRLAANIHAIRTGLVHDLNVGINKDTLFRDSQLNCCD